MTMETAPTIDTSLFSPHQFEAGTEEVDQARRAVARLVEFVSGSFVSFPVHATYAIVENPVPEPVPGMSHYAYGLIEWQDGLIPMIDLFPLLYGASARKLTPRYALIVAYLQEDTRAIKYGAIGLSTLPVNVPVEDEDQCDLPVDSSLWSEIALSCFLRDGKAVPIIDTTRLFDRNRIAET